MMAWRRGAPCRWAWPFSEKGKVVIFPNFWTLSFPKATLPPVQLMALTCLARFGLFLLCQHSRTERWCVSWEWSDVVSFVDGQSQFRESWNTTFLRKLSSTFCKTGMCHLHKNPFVEKRISLFQNFHRSDCSSLFFSSTQFLPLTCKGLYKKPFFTQSSLLSANDRLPFKSPSYQLVSAIVLVSIIFVLFLFPIFCVAFHRKTTISSSQDGR